AREREEAQMLVGLRRVDRRAVIELGAVDEKHGSPSAGQPGHGDGVAVTMRTDVERDVPQVLDGTRLELAPVHLPVERNEQAHVMAGGMQMLRERGGDVREAAGLGQGGDFRGDETDIEGHRVTFASFWASLPAGAGAVATEAPRDGANGFISRAARRGPHRGERDSSVMAEITKQRWTKVRGAGEARLA